MCFGTYLQDSHNPGLFMLGTYLLHQVDALHRLEFLSIDEEHRTPGLGVKVMFQREHPSIQGHSTPGIKQTSGAATKELRQEYLGWRGIEWDSISNGLRTQKARNWVLGPTPSYSDLTQESLLEFILPQSKGQMSFSGSTSGDALQFCRMLPHSFNHRVYPIFTEWLLRP